MTSWPHRGFGPRVIALAMFLAIGGVVSAQEQEVNAASERAEVNTAREKESSSSEVEVVSTNAVPSASRNFSAQFLKDLVGDQASIWTSPRNLGISDASWIIPIGGVTSALIVTDADYSKHISHNPTTLTRYNNVSNAGVAALAGGAGAMWALSYVNHDPHWRETGYLAVEAAINTFAITEAGKYTFGRERPLQGNGNGDFFSGGVSFPSDHSSVAWSIAGVIAHEYPGPLTRLLVYSAAGLVSYSRMRALQHFPSDVFVGGLVGDMVAQTSIAAIMIRNLAAKNGSLSVNIFELTCIPPRKAPAPRMFRWTVGFIPRLSALLLAD